MGRLDVSRTLVTAFITACASAPPPSERMALAESAVRSAREVGAERVPTAELHVRLADEEIQKARVLSGNDQNEHADIMLQRAMADAELARALAREEITRNEAERALEQARSLKETNETP